jgi:hypothetical protein
VHSLTQAGAASEEKTLRRKVPIILRKQLFLQKKIYVIVADTRASKFRIIVFVWLTLGMSVSRIAMAL